MSRSSIQQKNTASRWKKIKEQFIARMDERTPSGARPRFTSVVESLAEDWCMSPHSIEAILRKEIISIN